MLKITIGHSEDVDSTDAIHEILDHCRQELEGLIPQAGILYSAIGYDYEVLLSEILENFPDIELVGCTTDGEITSQLGFTEDTIALILFYSDTIEIKAGIGHHLLESPKQCGIDAGKMAQPKLSKSPALSLTFPNGLEVKKDAALNALQKELGTSVPIFGGFSAEQAEWKNTFQFYKAEVHTNSMPVLIFGGDLQFSHGLASGWHPIGKKGQVTKVVDGSYVYEIDHQPALDFYRHYLGPLALQSRDFPLAIYDKNQKGYYIRTVLEVDEAQNSLIISGDLTENSYIQIAEATREQMLQGAIESIQQASNSFPGEKPEAALIFSCAARKEILGTKTQEEYQLVQSCTEGKFPVIGFYSYGEICPPSLPSPTRLHSGTFITLLIGGL